MSTSVEERVVAMKLSNSQFEQNAKRTLSTIGSLDKALQMKGAAKGFQAISTAANKTDLGPIGRAVDSIAGKFNALTVIGYTALANLTSRAIDAGLSIAKSLTIDPINAGFKEYELKLGSIQTILANTAQYGTKLPEVNKYLNQLNDYADKTIYNFGDMTRNIGLFTNAGIRVGTATKIIQGFSNVAAASGTNAGEAARAAYQLSQALNTGVVRAQDWISLTNAGMGGSAMRRDLIAIATAMGDFQGKAEYAKLAQTDFKGSLEGKWLTSKTMSKYLQIMATDYDAMTKSQLENNKQSLRDIGLKDKQIDQMIKYQKLAQNSATKVRTLTQLVGTTQEQIGSGWAQTAEIILGDFTQATKLFTSISDYLGKNIGNWTDARNKTLKAWAKDGGREALINGLANAWKALLSVLKPIKDAFREIFPAKTGKQLADMTRTFEKFTKGLILGKENMENLKNTFKGLFAILSVGWEIVKFTLGQLAALLGIAQNGSGSILALTGALGEFLVKVKDWLISSKQIGSWFSTINTARLLIIVPLVDIIGKLGEALALLFKGDLAGAGEKVKEAFQGLGPLIQGIWLKASTDLRTFLGKLRDATGVAAEFVKGLGIKALAPIQKGLQNAANWLKEVRIQVTNFGMDAFTKATDTGTTALQKFNDAGKSVKNFWQGFRDGIGSAAEWFGPFGEELGQWMSLINEKLQKFIGDLDINDAIALLNTAFFIQLYRTISKFVSKLDNMTSGFNDFGGHLKGILSEMSGSLTDTMKTMQNNIKSDIILKIAFAIGVLAASLWVLSNIEPARLAQGVGAIATLMVGLKFLMGSLLGMMEEVEGKSVASTGKILAAGASILLLSLGILVLSAAVKNLSSLSWEELAKGLIGVGVLLTGLTLFTKFSTLEKGGAKVGAGLLLMSVGIYILARSVKTLADLDTGALIQGTVAISALIAVMSYAANQMGDTKSIKGALGITLMAGALAVLTPVITALGFLPLENLAKGLGAISYALVAFAISTQIMGDTKSLKGAAGILLMASAMAVLAPVILTLGFLPYENLAKGLGTLAISLIAFAIAAKIMGNPQSIAGAAGILLMAFAMAQLAPVIILLGQADWGTLAKGLGAFALALVIFLAAGLAAMYVGPGLLMIGAAIALIGAGALAAGAGMALFAAGLATLATIGTAAFAVITAGIIGFLNLIPLMAQQVGLGIRAIAVVIGESGPQFVKAMTTLIMSLLKAIDNSAPKFFDTMERLIVGLVKTVHRMIPQLAASGATMIVKMIHTIAAFVGPMADAATQLMINFINAIARNVPKLVDAGAKAIIRFVNGLSDAIDNNSEAMGRAGGRLAASIIRGMVNGINAGIGEVAAAARNIASSALDTVKSWLGIKSPSKEFEKLGRYSVQGYAKGLRGDRSEINAAYKTMNSLLRDAYKAAGEDIDRLEKRLKKLRSARNKDAAAIRKTLKELKQARLEYSRTKSAIRLADTFDDETRKLKNLADKLDKVGDKLDAANQKLEEAKRTRDDYNKSVQDQYSKLPDISGDTKLTDFITSLEKQIVDSQIFNAQLAELRKRGLNDEAYKLLLSKGTEAIPFATQLLDGGQVAVDQLNTLQGALADAANALGSNASTELYQAGVDAAQGLVDGLESQASALEAQMDKLADYMVNAIKRKLGIKSPSRVFKEQGIWSVKGLAKGLEASSSITEKAAENVGADTINALRKTLSGLSETAMEGVDLDPVIRPVLDLSQIKADAIKMEALFGGNGLSVGAQFNRALLVAAEQSALQRTLEQIGAGDSFTFNQYNTSPKALSDATIYRQTKNQLSTARGALKN